MSMLLARTSGGECEMKELFDVVTSACPELCWEAYGHAACSG